MTNLEDSRHDLESYIAARVPFIAIRTMEQPRALRLLREIAGTPRRANLSFSVFTNARGLRDLRTSSSLSDDRSLGGALEHAAQQFASRPQASAVFVDPEDLTDDSRVARHFSELVRAADENSGSVIMITDAPVWSGLSRLGMTIMLDLPTTEEMYALIVDFLRDHHGVVPIEWGEDEARRASETLTGVTEAEAVNLMATITTKGSIDNADVLTLARSKDKIFGDLAGLERVHLAQSDYTVGGLTNLRGWLQQRKKLMLMDLRETALRSPRGVLLVGVPGCGKSLSAKAISAEWQLPIYRLDLAAVLGQYVGQSEGRLREAMETAERVAPCVLWIDEIEKGLSGDDSSGVSKRLIGQFLFWLQESTAKCFGVATANDVRSLPPELLRKGRFDELFFVDLPVASEREEIIKLYARRYLKTDLPESQLAKLVTVSEGFAGSDLEAAVHEVAAAMLINERTELDPEFMLSTFVNTSPLSRTNPEQIEEIRTWGRERAVPAGATYTRQSPDSSGPTRRVLLMDD
jgi:ATPase family associated with various cellular activities (AAA)